MKTYHSNKGGLIKTWHEGVHIDKNTLEQLDNLASMPFIHKWVASMPDAHLGKGCAIGTVVATDKAIIPAAVGVDLGCGMQAVKTSLKAHDLPDDLRTVRLDMEAVIPVGFGKHTSIKLDVADVWESQLAKEFDYICNIAPVKDTNNINHLGTLGGGNHFVEVCLDEDNSVWIMLHSGSRGVGNAIGRYFIEKAKEEMKMWFCNIPDVDLSYLPEGSKYFGDYVRAVDWAQKFAKWNRKIMMHEALDVLRKHTKEFSWEQEAIDCHHNYVKKENHYGANVWVTRKGAVSARKGQLGIIPGSMGAKSFIVEGLGNEESFCSCSHGAGRVMSRTKAKKMVSLAEHKKSVEGVECRTDNSVIDETPSAYKDIDKVMEAQNDLVRIRHTLKQVMCIKG